MDRIDIHIDVPAVNYKELRGVTTNRKAPPRFANASYRPARSNSIVLPPRRAKLLQRPDEFPPDPGHCDWALTASACWNAPCTSRA